MVSQSRLVSELPDVGEMRSRTGPGRVTGLGRGRRLLAGTVRGATSKEVGCERMFDARPFGGFARTPLPSSHTTAAPREVGLSNGRMLKLAFWQPAMITDKCGQRTPRWWRVHPFVSSPPKPSRGLFRGAETRRWALNQLSLSIPTRIVPSRRCTPGALGLRVVRIRKTSCGVPG